MVGERRRPRIGVVINSLSGYFNKEMLLRLRANASLRGFDLFFFPGHRVNSPLLFERQFNLVFALADSPELDGLICATAYVQGFMTPHENFDFVNRFKHLPMVSLNFAMPGRPSVMVDNRVGFVDLLRHLLNAHGYRRIAFMHGTLGNFDAEERYGVYRQCLDEANIECDERLVARGNFNKEQGRAAMVELLDRGIPFDALVCANDDMALAALTVAVERGFHVPQDFAITGFDDILSFAKHGQSLTTINQSIDKIIDTAVDNLLAQIRGESVPETTTLPTRLVIRQSCGCVAHPVAGKTAAAVTRALLTSATAILEPLLLTADEYPQFVNYLDELTHGLEGDEKTFSESLGRMAHRCVMRTGDVTPLQLLLLSIYQSYQSQVDMPAQKLQRIGAYLLRGQIVVANANNVSKVTETMLEDSSDFFKDEMSFLKRSTCDASFETILDLIEQAIRQFKIPSAYVVIYDKPFRFQALADCVLPATSQLVFAMTQDVRQHDDLNTWFPTRDWLPGTLMEASSEQMMTLCPIFRHDEHFGYIIFDLKSRSDFNVEAMRDEISTFLIHALQVGNLSRTRDLLTRDLGDSSRRNTVLYEEVVALSLRLQTLFDAAVEVAIIATDAQGKIDVFNRGAQRMLGYQASDILGQSPLKLHLPSEIEARAAELSSSVALLDDGFEAVVFRTRDGVSEVRNWTYVTQGGSLVDVSVAVSAVRNEAGRVTGYLCIARDISDQLAAQAALQRLNLELDDRVSERTQALQVSTEELQTTLANLQRAQSQLVQSEKLAALGSMVAGVSHELNTPIGNCITVCSTLSDDFASFSGAIASGNVSRQRLHDPMEMTGQGLEMIEKGLARAVRLIEAFKQTAVDQISEQRRSFDVRETIIGVVTLMSASLKRRPFTITTDFPHDLTMDSFPGALEQVVANLINNSVLHGFAERDHGIIRIVATASESTVLLTYSDDGVGMPASVLERIFDPFFTTRLGQGGNGLGMNICYNLIVGPLAGRIEVQSEVGKGSLFSMELPLVA